MNVIGNVTGNDGTERVRTDARMASTNNMVGDVEAVRRRKTKCKSVSKCKKQLFHQFNVLILQFFAYALAVKCPRHWHTL
jgi:hypothetical protein